MAGRPHPLTFYVDFALENYRPPETVKTLKAGIADYLAARKRELDQDQLSLPQDGKVSWELKRLEKRSRTSSSQKSPARCSPNIWKQICRR